MLTDVVSENTLPVTYEPIELHSQIKYERRSFIDRFKVSSNSRENLFELPNVVEGNLTIDFEFQRLHFIPFQNDYKDLQMYRDNFRDKYFIEFYLIKQILFQTQKNEYYLKSKEIPNKSFRSFVIYCYDFRVYNFNRRFKLHKVESSKFYQTLAKSIIDSRRNSLGDLNWTLANPRKLMSIYTDNVKDNVDVELMVSREAVTFTPKVLCDKKKFRFDVKYMPQIVFRTQNDSILIICKRPDSKSMNDICHSVSKAIMGKEVWNQTMYYMEGHNKSEGISPNNKDLMDCFEKLYSICTPRNKSEFKRIDKKWFSKLADSGWLTLVNKCLQNVNHIVKSMEQSKSFVYLMENSSPVWAWFFVSLVQVYLQPSARTSAGFNSLIKKNWIITNLFCNTDSLHPALFLLFLDCVYQFLRSSPFSFEFGEEMLICIYDLSVMFPNGLLMNNIYDLGDIDWKKLYEQEVVDCFVNNYYDSEKRPLSVPIIECYDYESFWIKMYTRWIPYMQIESGGWSPRHYAMTAALGLHHSVHSNYPFSLNYDKMTRYNEDSCHDDTRSINTIISEE